MTGALLDTNILIDYLRDRPAAVAFLRGLEGAPVVSALTIAELYAGVREGAERERLDNLLSRLLVPELDELGAKIGGLYHRDYRRSHGLDLVDALIAATAERHGLRLATRNARHFPMLADVLVPY